jgi:microcystin-dependent protein
MENEIIESYRRVPIGSVITFAGSKEIFETYLDQRFIICDGRELSKFDYPELFSVIGTIWGGTGTPNFNIPNLLGRFLRGADFGSGIDPDSHKRIGGNGDVVGGVVGGYQEDAIQSHNHNTTVMIGDNNVDGVDSTTKRSGEHHNEIKQTSVPINAKLSSETRPKNAAVLFLIRC